MIVITKTVKSQRLIYFLQAQSFSKPKNENTLTPLLSH